MSSEVVSNWIEQLHAFNTATRLGAVKALKALGSEAKDALDSLWTVASTDHIQRVRREAAHAVAVIEEDRTNLLSKSIEFLEDDALGLSRAAIAVMVAAWPHGTDQRGVIDTLWKFIQKNQDVELIEDAFRAVVEITVGNNEVIDQLIDDKEIEPWKKSHLILIRLIRDGLNNKWKRDKETLLPLILGTLEDNNGLAREAAVKWLAEKSEDIPSGSRDTVLKALWKCFHYYGQGSQAIKRIGGSAAIDQAISDGDIEPGAVGRLLLTEESDLLGEKWTRDEEKKTVLQLVLAALEDDTWDGRRVAADWMGERAGEIPWGLFDLAYDELVERLRSEDDPETRRSVGQALDQFKIRKEQHERTSQTATWIETLRSGDEDAQVKAIEKLVGMGTRGALRSLIQEWLQWIVLGEKALLVEEAADAMRSSRFAVLPLIDQLDQHRETGEFKNSILNVPRRIARQLADMSDPRFFEGKEKEYETVKKELDKHAVPALARRLPQEADFEVRECLARTLGNIGGREAVDSLARAVVGDERTRSHRQQLLSNYYLEPSKQRSEEAAKILKGAVAEAKRTLRLVQLLNIALFLVGLAMIVGGLLVSITNEDNAARVVGALAGFGGFAGVIVQLIRDPLNRIQNAMANLVQIETAFTGFFWELNLNSTYIQSQYVAEGILTEDEIEKTVDRIENAMGMAMSRVAFYTEEGSQRIVTRINKLSPAADEAGSVITIHGQHLQGDSSKKKERTGLILINHTPTRMEVISWNGFEVKFELPVMEKEKGTIWVSLLIDGMETNALPFHLVKKQS